MRGKRFAPRALPARLGDAGDVATVGEFPEADTADAVVPDIATRTAADLAPIVGADLKFRLPHALLN